MLPTPYDQLCAVLESDDPDRVVMPSVQAIILDSASVADLPVPPGGTNSVLTDVAEGE